MNKKAAIKKAVRDSLARRPDMTATLERPAASMASLNYGSWNLEFTFSEYDDDGDPSTEEEYNDIYSAIEAIISDHNSQAQ